MAKEGTVAPKERVNIVYKSEVAGAQQDVELALKFESLADFGPEGVVNQVPELRKLQELRAALTALKGPLGNVPAFRKKIQALLGEDATREKLMAELGLK